MPSRSLAAIERQHYLRASQGGGLGRLSGSRHNPMRSARDTSSKARFQSLPFLSLSLSLSHLSEGVREKRQLQPWRPRVGLAMTNVAGVLTQRVVSPKWGSRLTSPVKISAMRGWTYPLSKPGHVTYAAEAEISKREPRPTKRDPGTMSRYTGISPRSCGLQLRSLCALVGTLLPLRSSSGGWVAASYRPTAIANCVAFRAIAVWIGERRRMNSRANPA